jgi:hypothetical protein
MAEIKTDTSEQLFPLPQPRLLPKLSVKVIVNYCLTSAIVVNEKVFSTRRQTHGIVLVVFL